MGDEVAGIECGFNMRGCAGEQVEFGDGDVARAGCAVDGDDGFEGCEGDIHVGRVGGDTVLARSQNREGTVVAFDGRTAGAGCAFVAGHGGIAEVHAAGALEEVAAGGGHVAELSRCAGEQRLRED